MLWKIEPSRIFHTFRLAQREVLDTSRFQCVYQHLVYEPERDAMRDYYEILLVGSSYSKYEDYAAYQLDSLMKTIPTEEMTFNDYFALSMRYKSEPESLIRDFKSDNMTFYGRVYVDNYTLCGDKCTKIC